MADFLKPPAKKLIRGYAPLDESSSDEDDAFPVFRYAKKPKVEDIQEGTRYAGDPVQLVNEFMASVCPFGAADCWNVPDNPKCDTRPPVWLAAFEMRRFRVVRRARGGRPDRLDTVEGGAAIEGTGSTKQSAKRAAAKNVLDSWHADGLVSEDGFRLVGRPRVMRRGASEGDRDEVLPSTIRDDDIAAQRDAGTLPEFTLLEYGVTLAHDAVVRDAAALRDAVTALQQAREHVWKLEKRKLVAAIDLEWRPYQEYRDPKGSSGGPAAMLQLCYRDPYKRTDNAPQGALTVRLFHLPAIGGFFPPRTADSDTRGRIKADPFAPAPPRKQGPVAGGPAGEPCLRACCGSALEQLLHGLLHDDDIVKVGVNVFSDVRKMGELLRPGEFDRLEKDKAVRGDQVKFREFEDLQIWARKVGFQSTGLAPLLAILKKRHLPKDLTAKEENWEVSELSRRQIDYAARDVVATYIVGEELMAEPSRFQLTA